MHFRTTAVLCLSMMVPLFAQDTYHRHVDHAHEGGLRLGLWSNAPNSIADPHSK